MHIVFFYAFRFGNELVDVQSRFRLETGWGWAIFGGCFISFRHGGAISTSTKGAKSQRGALQASLMIGAEYTAAILIAAHVQVDKKRGHRRYNSGLQADF